MTSQKKRKAGLGRGIEALLGDVEIPRRVRGASREDTPLSSGVLELRKSDDVHDLRYCEVDIGCVLPNPKQPRKVFSESGLQELAQSIKCDGVLQPIVVTQHGHQFHVVAGERRLRAAKLAGLSRVPVIVRCVAEKERLRLALIENIQREDLNPLEEAEAYREVIALASLSQEECGKMVGKSRATITNSLRLLELPQRLHERVASRELSAGHARALLGLDGDQQMLDVADRVCAERLSVRATEYLCRQIKQAAGLVEGGCGKPSDDGDSLQRRERGPVFPQNQKDSHFLRLEQDLRSYFGTRVALSGNMQKGKIEVHYFSGEELERVLGVMGV